MKRPQNPIPTLLLTLLLVAAVPIPAAPANDDQGIRLEDLQRLAESGDADSQYILGLLYEVGKGVEKDPKAAAEFYEKAAQQGHGKAMTNLGAMYHKGLGVPQDPEKARYWYEKAAEAGLPKAQYNLALFYAGQEPGQRDLNKTRYWFTQAAQQGHPRAQVNLGVMYAEGLGVEPDLEKAVFWLSEAARQGLPQAQARLEKYLPQLPQLQIKRPRVNIRQQSSLESRVIARRNPGAVVYQLGKSADGKWYHIYLPGAHQLGYVAAFLVRPAG